MLRRLRILSVPLVTVLAACGGEAETTGWIPANAGISGVISVASEVAPPSPTSPPSTQDPPLALASPPTADVLVHRAPPDAWMSPSERAHAVYAPTDLIVTLRSLGGSVPRTSAITTASEAQAVGAAMRSHLSAVLPEGATIAGVSPVILTARIRVRDSAQWEAVAAALREDPAVSSVERNRLLSLDVAGPAAGLVPRTPNNPLYVLQAWHYALIDLPRAWGVTTGSSSVLVAVVDDGIRFDHPGIAGNLTTDGYDFVSSGLVAPACAGGNLDNSGDGNGVDPDPTIPATYGTNQAGTCFLPADLGAHGLHVAGTIGAVGNNGIGVTGVNWTVRVRPVRVLGVLGVGQSYDIAQGILYAAGLPADNGAGGTVQPSTAARIINLSLGGSGDDPVMHNAVLSAANAGVFIVAAAGNTGNEVLHYPAAYPEVFAAAAVRPDGLPATYSTYGSFVDIRAPGGDFAQGGGSGGVGSTVWNFKTVSPDYGFYAGTSMAAPHVSGVAALLLAKEPSLTAGDLRTRLTRWAVGPANAWGAGLLNAYNSLTQSFGPPRKLFVRLYSAGTGESSETVPAGDDGSYSFSHVRDGAYFVYGGTDEDGDGQIGLPGRWWGAVGGPVAPTRKVLLSESAEPASFSVGIPSLLVPNHSLTTPYVLVVGGYVQALYADRTQLDAYRLKVAKFGTYIFETSGWGGACGFALEEATGIGVYDLTGRLIASSTYIDSSRLNYCTRLSVNLSAGEYVVGVAGAFNGGRYRLQARSGP